MQVDLIENPDEQAAYSAMTSLLRLSCSLDSAQRLVQNAPLITLLSKRARTSADPATVSPSLLPSNSLVLCLTRLVFRCMMRCSSPALDSIRR